jgi:hypothetical protein
LHVRASAGGRGIEACAQTRALDKADTHTHTHIRYTIRGETAQHLRFEVKPHNCERVSVCARLFASSL